MLVEAVRAGDMAAIREALAGGARLNTPQGSTALMIALGDNLPVQHPGIIELLLEHGADVNLPDRRGMTPLLQALEVVSDGKLLQAILAHGGDVRVVSRDGHSVVCAAAQRGLTEVAESALESGAPPDIPTNRGTTALMALASGLEWDAYREDEYVQLARKLIARGADPRRTDSLGKSPADYAFDRGNLELLKLLDLDGKYSNRVAGMRTEALSRKLEAAIRAQKPEEVKRMLEAGADPNGISPRTHSSMLGVALQQNPPFPSQKFNLEILTVLLSKGANPNTPINDTDLPLTAAAGDASTLALLLAHGADANAASAKDGLTALHRSARADAVDSIELLLSKGARIEARSALGFTPWLLAVAQGQRAAADLLSAKGADTTVKTASGESAADLAAAIFDIELLRRLDRPEKYADLLAQFSPPKTSAMIGDWVTTKHGREMTLRLLPSGGGSIQFASKRPLAWTEADAGVLIITTLSDERFPQPRKLEGSVTFDAAAQTIQVALPSAMGERPWIYRRPGTPAPADPPAVAADDEKNQKQQIATELARARMSNQPGVNLVGSTLRELPDELFRIIGLQSLMIQNSALDRLPGRIAALALLKRITVTGNRITQVDDEVFELQNLEGLDLSRNRIKTVSKRVTGLSKLIELNLYDNRLVSLPEGWEKMAKLRSVRIDNNWLKALPASLAHAPALDRLSASDNVLSGVPDEFAHPQGLTSLSLDNNRFGTFPKAICELRSLEYLGLSQNDLSEVAADLSKMTGLRRLNLSGNRLTAIPEAIKGTQIEELELSGNKIKAFPADPSSLPSSLRTLDLQDNEITEIPAWIESIGLRDLRLRGNPMPEEKIRALEQRIGDQRKRK
jgi:Leucine-rich repeat (LRR) protein/ankyrin repeat protein